jgi:hypothetical protein
MSDAAGSNCPGSQSTFWRQWWFALIICIFAAGGLGFMAFRYSTDGAAAFWQYDGDQPYKHPMLFLFVFALAGTCIDFLIYRYYSIGGDGNGKGATPIEAVPWFKTMWFFFIVTMVFIALVNNQFWAHKTYSAAYQKLQN